MRTDSKMKAGIRMRIVAFLALGVFVVNVKPLAPEASAPLQKEAAAYWMKITGKEMPRDAITFVLDESVSRGGNDAYAIRAWTCGRRADSREPST